MVLVDVVDSLTLDELTEPFPRDVSFVISALEAGPRPIIERQRTPRVKYQVRGLLKLFSDQPDDAPSLLYTRHIHSRAVGFLCDRELPLSHGGILRLPSPSKSLVQIACTILRCRHAAPGWFEGAIYFNREQPLFLPEALA